MNVPSRNTNADSFEEWGATFSALKTFIKNKDQSDDACFEMSENLIFPINYHIDIVYVEKIIVAKG
jgi:hypothetical protein